MKDQIASGIVVVKVTLPPDSKGLEPWTLYAVALPRDEAVEAVRRELGNDWPVELTEQTLSQDEVRRLSMKLGSVRRLG